MQLQGAHVSDPVLSDPVLSDPARGPGGRAGRDRRAAGGGPAHRGDRGRLDFRGVTDMTSPDAGVLDELSWRGLIAESTDRDALREHLAAGPVTFYVGFDPTAP